MIQYLKMFQKSRQGGFTLVELVIYVGIFSIASVFLTGTLITTLRVQSKELANNEVMGQITLVIQTVQRLVRDSSLIEKVYDGAESPSNLTCPTSSQFCTVKLRMQDPALDPTYIRGDAAGFVYVKQGAGDEVALTNDRVVLDSLQFKKNDIAGGHATLQVDSTMHYNSTSQQLAATRSLRTVVGRVNAAVFDSNLLPGADNSYDFGTASGPQRWKEGHFAGNVTIGGNVGIGTTTDLDQILTINGGITLRTTDGRPECNSISRGTFWVTQSAAGTKDDVEVCAKNAADAYDWRTIY